MYDLQPTLWIFYFIYLHLNNTISFQGNERQYFFWNEICEFITISWRDIENDTIFFLSFSVLNRNTQLSADNIFEYTYSYTS